MSSRNREKTKAGPEQDRYPPADGIPSFPSPRRKFWIAISLIIVLDAVFLWLLHSLTELIPPFEVVIHAGLLFAATVPVLIFLFYRPMLRHGRRIRFAEQAMRESEAQYRTVAEDTPVLLCRFLPGGEITYVNEAYCRYFNRERHELIGKTFLSLIPEQAHDKVLRRIEELTPEIPTQTHEHPVLAPQGNIRWQRWTNRAIFDSRGAAEAYQSIGEDITERIEAKAALQEREEQLRSIFRAAPVGIGLVSDRIFLQVNDKVCEITGYTHEELIGQNARILYPTQEEFETVGREKYEQISRLGTGTVETRWQRKDGKILNILLSSTPIHPDDHSKGVTFTALDITDRIIAEKEVDTARVFLQRVINTLSDGIIVINRDYTVALMNDVFFEMVEGNCESPEPPLCYKLFHNLDRPCHELGRICSLQEVTREKAPYKVETDFENISRHVYPLELIASPIFDDKGEVIQIIESLRDLSERRQAEEERIELERQIQHTQKLESLGVLAGGIAHDFNNLLMSIIGNADLALMDLAELAPARSKVEAIEQAACRAADLCNQMLAYSGKGRFELRTLQLGDLVEEMTHILDVSISKKATLIYRFDKGEDSPSVEADPTQIRQVVMNLITNASEALGEQNGEITISTGSKYCDEAYLSESRMKGDDLEEGLYTFIDVADTGCGMDQETMAKIFEPFFTTKFTGRGLGLAATMGIVRGHKGTIKIYSEPGEGTLFRILLPASTNPVTAGQTVSASQNETWKGEGTLLLVDDEKMVLDVVSLMLQRFGFKIITASNGREAIDIYKESGKEISVVLLDLTMPNIDGEECFHELRRINPGVRVIISSGYTEQEVTQRFMGEGVTGYIQKPYNSKGLEEALKKALVPV